MVACVFCASFVRSASSWSKFDWRTPGWFHWEYCWRASADILWREKSRADAADMGAQVERISAANLHERLDVRNATDELGRLARTFNDLLDR